MRTMMNDKNTTKMKMNNRKRTLLIKIVLRNTNKTILGELESETHGEFHPSIRDTKYEIRDTKYETWTAERRTWNVERRCYLFFLLFYKYVNQYYRGYYTYPNQKIKQFIGTVCR